VYVHYFPPDVHGKLLPGEKRILINAHKPRYEHSFTLLHEIGHYVRHVLIPRRKYHPRILDINWKINFLAEFASYARRSIRFIYNKQSSKEREADLWAMCAFVHLSKHFGCRAELTAFLERHPEKFGLYLLTASATAFCGIRARIMTAIRAVTL
jgi:oligoendopeptidase F